MEINGEAFKKRAISNVDEQFMPVRLGDETRSHTSFGNSNNDEDFKEQIGEFMNELIKSREQED